MRAVAVPEERKHRTCLEVDHWTCLEVEVSSSLVALTRPGSFEAGLRAGAERTNTEVLIHFDSCVALRNAGWSSVLTGYAA